MADPHPHTHTHDAHDHHGPDVKTYMVIFGALVVFTALSFLFNWLANRGVITHTTSFLAILTVAVIKATLVAMFFMHLKFDWGRVYFIVIPVMVLCVMMMIILLPDIVLGWTEETGPTSAEVRGP